MSATEYRRKRGIIKRSITNLNKRLTELEESTEAPDKVHCHAQRLLTRLQDLDSEFRTLHYQVVGTIADGEDEALDGEQATLDKHDTDVDEYLVRIQQLIMATTAPPPTTDVSDKHSSLVRVLAYLEESIRSIETGLAKEDLADLALIQQYQEELTDLKPELSTCREISNTLDLKEDDELRIKYMALKTKHFDCCRKSKSILLAIANSTSSIAPSPSSTSTTSLRIPKLEAPTFDGDILNWTRFWEQFTISIDEHEGLTDAEKFVYLQQSLKGGSARTVIEGLSGTGEHYQKATECLKARYDRPRLIHQSHVKMIVETLPLKDGNGRELRCLHDLLQQHLRALDAEENEGLGQFITSIIQLKLDPDTLFEWQKHTQDITKVPPFQKLLEFIDLRARASEATPHTNKRTRNKQEVAKKSVASFVANSESSGGRCTVYKSERHPLYYCPRFKEMNHDRKLATVKANKLCMNCLKSGHFLKDCKSPHHCRTCQKPNHTLLHVDTVLEPNDPLTPSSTVVSSNTAVSNHGMLMKC